MPLDQAIHNIKLTFETGGQLARVAGVVVKLIAKKEKCATLKLHIGEIHLISKNNLITSSKTMCSGMVTK
ncbi:putative ribosomal protein L2 [Helianthus anomalus]